MRLLTPVLILAIFPAISAAQAQPPSNASVIEANKKIEADNLAMRTALADGLAAYQAKKYDEAIVHFEKGMAISAENRPIFGMNKALALQARAVARYNSSFQLSDAAAKNQAAAAAKNDWKAAGETINTAAAQAKAAYPRGDKSITDILKAQAEIMGVVVTRVDPTQLAAAETVYKEYFAVETAPAARLSAHLGLGKMLFYAGQHQKAAASFEIAIAALPDNIEAIYGLGTSLFALEKDLQRSANLLNRFLQLAPAADTRRPDAKAALDYYKAINITPK